MWGMQNIPHSTFIPYRLMFGVLLTLFVLAVLFPPVFVAQTGASDVHLEWRLRFFAARLPGEQVDVFFLALEVTALATLSAWLRQARHAWKPRFATETAASGLPRADRAVSAEQVYSLNRF